MHLWRAPARIVGSSDDFKRRVLSHYAAVAPQEWRFDVGTRGKPALLGPALPESLQTLQFNLSHSRDWLVCAISGAAHVGIDLEYCDPARDTLKLARRFFHPGEVLALEACAAAVGVDRFYDYWTLKEARVKASGEALALSLDSRSFEFAGWEDDAVARVAALAPDSAATVQYLLWDLPASFRLAVCRIGDIALPPRLRLLELDDKGLVGEFEASLRATSLQR